MKNIQNKIILLLLITIALPNISFAQEASTTELTFEVNRVFSPLSMTNEKLAEAQTLNDLNHFYRPSWVKEYYSVEILTTHQGKIKKSLGKNDIITPEQKESMTMADAGSDITVNVHYLPQNTLKQNDPKEMNFSFKVVPSEAIFASGEQQMKKYLEKNAIDKISIDKFQKHNYNLVAVKFTVNEEGKIINPQIVESSKDENVDTLLIQTISNMPNWKPSEYPNGTKVKQDYMLTFGDHRSCVVNLLNIRQDW